MYVDYHNFAFNNVLLLFLTSVIFNVKREKELYYIHSLRKRYVFATLENAGITKIPRTANHRGLAEHHTIPN